MATDPSTFWPRVARRLTEAAARACAPWIGESDKEAADGAAVQAMRDCLSDADVQGTVVIGEGEKDDAPYLAPGAQIGTRGPAVDIAVDPLEGTTLVANDDPGALSVLALAPAESIVPLGRAFYAEKLVGPPVVADALDLDAPPVRVVSDVADALDLPPTDVRVAVQRRPRHAGLVEALREAGADVHLFAEGDLSYAILALQARDEAEVGTCGKGPNRTAEVDLLWSIGGAPEGILTAAAQRILGGSVQFRVAPRSIAERTRLPSSSLGRTFAAADLVRAEAVGMALTGVTDGPLLDGIRETASGLRTDSLVLGPGKGPQRVESLAPPTGGSMPAGGSGSDGEAC